MDQCLKDDDISLLVLAQSICSLAIELEKCVDQNSQIAKAADEEKRTVRQQIAATYAGTLYQGYCTGKAYKLRKSFLKQNSDVFLEEVCQSPYNKIVGANRTDTSIYETERQSFINFVLRIVKNSENSL